jgi:hypothetical protein
MKKALFQEVNRKARKAFRPFVLLSVLLTVGACGEYFGEEYPEEFDPESLPTVTTMNCPSRINMTLGEVRTLNPTVTGGKRLSTLSAEDQAVALSRLYAMAAYGDEVVKVRQNVLTGMNIGEDVVYFSDAENTWHESMTVVVSENTIKPTSLTLSRTRLVLMEGESFTVSATVKPAALANTLLVWTSQNDSVATASEGLITAVTPGTTTVHVTTYIPSDVSATLEVIVLPDFKKSLTQSWRYETFVYASVTLDDVPISSTNTLVAAICNDEVRAVGKTNTEHGITYTLFRIGSNELSNADTTYKAHFIGYETTKHEAYDFDVEIVLDGEVHGTLSNLIQLKGILRK